MKLPKLNCQYGAPMGRHTAGGRHEGGKCVLRHIPLDSGGYDSGGAYWGLGQ